MGRIGRGRRCSVHAGKRAARRKQLGKQPSGGGELRPDKCSYTVHRMKPSKNGDWEYIKEKLATAAKKTYEDQEELDDLWEDMDEDELDDMDTVDAPFTFPLIGGDAAVIK